MKLNIGIKKMSENSQSAADNANWERQALEHLLLENLKETRKV